MKRILAIAAAALAAASAYAAIETVELASGKSVRVQYAAKVAAVQILAGTNAVTGASVSLVRGTSTNSVVTGIGVTNGLASASPENAVYALPGDGLVLSAPNAVRATAILEH